MAVFKQILKKCTAQWRVPLFVLLIGVLAGCNLPAGIGLVTPTPSLMPPTAMSMSTSTIQPVPIATEGAQLVAEGSDVFLAYSNCFDLDAGETSAGPDQACDFSVAPGPEADGLTIEFSPTAQAQFAFAGVYTQEPDVLQCSESEYLSTDTEIVNPLERYVCYQTNEGRYGVLYFSDLDAVNGISFDWKTYDKTGTVPTLQPTPTSTITPELETGIFKEGTESFLSFGNCYDFDEGALFIDDSACELTVESGEDTGEVRMIPQGISRFAAGGAFQDAPALEQCAGSTYFSNEEAEIQPAGYHYCYQTNDGRYGYVYISNVDEGNGITFDWITFAASSPIPTQTPEASPTVEPTLDLDTTDDDLLPTLGEADFDDEFNNATNWSIYTDSHVAFEVAGGKLKMTAANADYYEGFLISWMTIDDAYLEITTTTGGACNGPDRYGILFRTGEDEDNWASYMFGITCDGKYSLRYWDGHSFDPVLGWSPSTVIKTGANQTNRIGIKADGSAFSFYINGDLIGSITDPTADEGLFGLFIGGAHTNNFSVYVDRMRVWELP
ncbi:MAG: hypothetical protein JXA25_04150 [Anaerolineales bacterium]|nr:hypothetical protein [Anaerolineales bacterium]